MRHLGFSVCICVSVAALACEPKPESTQQARSGDDSKEQPVQKKESENEQFALTLTCVTQDAAMPKRTISVEATRGEDGTVRRSEDGLGIDAGVTDAQLRALYETVEGAAFKAFTDASPEDSAAPPMEIDCSLALTAGGQTVNKQYSNRQVFLGEAEQGRVAMHKALGELEAILLSQNRDPSLDPQGADPEAAVEDSQPPQ